VTTEKCALIDKMLVKKGHIIQGAQFNILIISQDEDNIWSLLESTDGFLIDCCCHCRKRGKCEQPISRKSHDDVGWPGILEFELAADQGTSGGRTPTF
jgi:hypothetical protein